MRRKDKRMRVLLKQVLLNPDNPRVKKDADYKRLKTSLAQFPQMLKVRGLGIVDNGDGTYTVLGGNQRRSALSDLERVFGTPDFDKYGADADAVQTLENYFKNGVPCQDCTNFNEEQRRRFIVTDNLSYAEWDTDAVRAGWSAEEIGAWGSDSILSAWEGEGDTAGDGDPFDDDGITAKNQFGVIVMCPSEEEQARVFDDLTKKGFNCKIVVV